MKKLFCLIFGLIFCLHASNALSDDYLNSSKYLELYQIDKTKDIEAKDNVIASLEENYSHFIPTGDGVSVRKGPGVIYAKHGRLLKNIVEGTGGHDSIDLSNLRHIGADTFLPWIGGIVSNEILPGDENCSGWQEIIMLEMSWLAWNINDIYPDYSGLDDNTMPAYVCIDFIEKSPLSEKDISNFKEAHFKNFE